MLQQAHIVTSHPPFTQPCNASARPLPAVVLHQLTCQRVKRHDRPVAAKRRNDPRLQQSSEGVCTPRPRTLCAQPGHQQRPVCQQVLRVGRDRHARCRQCRRCAGTRNVLRMLDAVRWAATPLCSAGPAAAAPLCAAAIAAAAAAAAAGSAAIGFQLRKDGEHFVHSAVPYCMHRHLQTSQPGVRGEGPRTPCKRRPQLYSGPAKKRECRTWPAQGCTGCTAEETACSSGAPTCSPAASAPATSCRSVSKAIVRVPPLPGWSA